MSELSEGFVIKAVPKGGTPSGPLWLLVPTDDSAFEFFGTREKAWVFPTQEEATAEAKRWLALLQPALSIVVERA
jgi:hypothetical protein